MREIDLQKRLFMLSITDTTIANLSLFHPHVRDNMDSMVAAFYRFIHQMPATAAIFKDHEVERRLKPAQKAHWTGLLAGQFDAAYRARALKIGMAHYRHKVAPYVYIAGYNFFHCELIRVASMHYEGQELAAVLQSITKVISLDMDLALSAYVRAAWLSEA